MLKQVKELIASEKYIHIKRDLEAQLKANDMEVSFYIDLVADYMDLWVTKMRLINTIHSKGIMTRYDHGGGQKGTKKNDAIDMLLRVNKQMLFILSELNINNPEGAMGENDLL